MTGSEIERLPFSKRAVEVWKQGDPRHANWPVVYVIDDGSQPRAKSRRALSDVYVGETLNAATRMRQHLDTPAKQHLRSIRVLLDETFNKSVCLDLEAYLIRMLSGDGAYRVLNRNIGITEANYFDRDAYRSGFKDVFDELVRDGVFTRTAHEIENSDLFKLSPFKTLSEEQAASVEDIVDGLIGDIESQGSDIAPIDAAIVVQGEPGTGKTVVAIYLMKLLTDIMTFTSLEDLDPDARFSEYFVEDTKKLLQGLRIGLVVPQQSLRESIKKVFAKTPGLRPSMVMTPFDVGRSAEHFDLLLVDESHRLNQRANQPSGVQNAQFRDVTTKLFGWDDKSKTQLDWIQSKSTRQIFFLDTAQSVRPADLPAKTLLELIESTSEARRYHKLRTQMRVQAGSDYVGYVRSLLGTRSRADLLAPATFDGYDLQLFDDIEAMRAAILKRDADVGLSRLVAGFAWPWTSKNDSAAFDITIDGLDLRWNSTATDWIASPGSVLEVGSIHTVQGYDLNYAGVIIGPDLRFDPIEKRLFVERASYFDKKGKENNPALGLTYSDDDLLRFITQIYGVLLTRGILGTFVYVCDAPLREYLRRFIPASSST